MLAFHGADFITYLIIVPRPHCNEERTTQCNVYGVLIVYGVLGVLYVLLPYNGHMQESCQTGPTPGPGIPGLPLASIPTGAQTTFKAVRRLLRPRSKQLKIPGSAI